MAKSDIINNVSKNTGFEKLTVMKAVWNHLWQKLRTK
jgi:hypothetical protein